MELNLNAEKYGLILSIHSHLLKSDISVSDVKTHEKPFFSWSLWEMMCNMQMNLSVFIKAPHIKLAERGVKHTFENQKNVQHLLFFFVTLNKKQSGS